VGLVEPVAKGSEGAVRGGAGKAERGREASSGREESRLESVNEVTLAWETGTF